MASKLKFLGLPLILNTLGLLAVFTATFDEFTQEKFFSLFFLKQAIFSVSGFLLLWFVSSKLPIVFYRGVVIGGFILFLVLSALTPIIGEETKGAVRWISLGFFRLQPSEFLKVFSVLIAAEMVSSAKLDSLLWERIKLFSLALLSGLLILAQPDAGTATLIFSIFWCAAFILNPSFSFLVKNLFIFFSALPLIWFFLLHDYQKNRLYAFFLKGSPANLWQVEQAEIAIGSAGFLGKGFLKGTQGRFELIPERHTDFIFSVWTEEFGLLGAAVLISLYAYFYYSLSKLEEVSPGDKPLITLTLFKLGSETVVNLFMNVGIFPVVGVALPFISYGGSNLLSNYLLLGFVYWKILSKAKSF